MKTKLLTLSLALFSFVTYAQTAIPDSNFETYLETHDSSGGSVMLGNSSSMGDGVYNNSVPTAKINGVTSLVIPLQSITDLTGIEDFVALQTLNCWGNPLGTLDLSNNTDLTTLTCNNCSLTSLTLPNTSSLTQIDCYNNNLMALDVSGNPNLATLQCFSNPNLGSLNVEINTDLTTLDCSNTGLSSLDVTTNINLLALRCGQNSISTIDLSNNTVLLQLELQFNAFTEIDVSNNTSLQNLNCYLNGSLESLDVSNNPQLSTLRCDQCNLSYLNVNNNNNTILNNLNATSNSLTCIQVDDVDQANAKPSWQKDVTAEYMLSCPGPAQTTPVPDAVFEQALIDLTIDTNGLNGNILNSDASGVTFLSVSGLGISDLTGIEAFSSLQYLYCDNNSLTSLDTSSNTLLESLYCGQNSLTSINVTGNPALTYLSCNENFNLTGIDVSQNPNLLNLNLQYNGSLASLDVTNNTALTFLNTWLAPLGSLNLTQNTALETLNCMSNNLTELDVSQNIALTSIDVRGNQLTDLDLSSNVNLYGIFCSSNALQTLNVKNGNNSNVTNGNFTAALNSLTCITVDNVAYSDANWFNIDVGVVFSTNCSLGIEEFNEDTVSIFPNPTKDKINVNLQIYATYSLTNLYGQGIRNGNFVTGTNELNIQSLSSGLYLLNLETPDGNVTKKIIKY